MNDEIRIGLETRHFRIVVKKTEIKKKSRQKDPDQQVKKKKKKR